MKTPPAPSASASARSGERRRLASGATSPSSTISSDVERRAAPTRAGARAARCRARSPGSRRPAISSSPGRRGGVDVLQRRRGRADDHDLVLEEARRRLALHRRCENETRLDRARRAVVVDPGACRRRRSRRGSTCCARSPTSAVATRERLQPVDAVRHAPLDAARVRRAGAPLPGRAPSSFSTSSPPRTFVSPCSFTSVVASTTLPVRARDRLEQRERRRSNVAGLGELDVVGDRLRVVGGDARRSPWRGRARERPAPVEVARR